VKKLLVGRELGNMTVGQVGLAPAAKPLAQLPGAFGAMVLGYNPAVHLGDAAWQRVGIPPVGLRELLQASEAVVVLLDFCPRYTGLFSERLFEECRPNMALVCLGHSALFDAKALARALSSGRLSGVWMDSPEPGLTDPGRPLAQISTLQVTPRVAAITRESRSRSAWAIARRIHALLSAAKSTPAEPASFEDLKRQPSDALADPAGEPPPA